MAAQLESVLRQVDDLSEEDKVRVLRHLVRSTRTGRRHRSWMGLWGIAPKLLEGRDAQNWVSAQRREDTDHRELMLGDGR